ncbi:hypothetical protein [Bacillus cereus group sp. Bce040]|uniref:hypothetical protein n=1 Tax=Bacillus cereus group sp. Bce040 TaxID=3445229 RepID=UPI003F288719
MNLRGCNLLWFEDPNTFSTEDLQLLKCAFEKGYKPLGDKFGEHNEEWIRWKEAAASVIKMKIG